MVNKPFTVTFNSGITAGGTGALTEKECAFREADCLNGAWMFQPVAVGEAVDEAGVPVLLPPTADGWSDTPLIVPSPWNGNAWGGNGSVDRTKPGETYRPDGLYYPSYPAEWIHVSMGWLRRTFKVPAERQGRRLVLHFDAVAGEATVVVNGRTVGVHFDSYLPFDCDVTDVVHDGENEVLVGVRSRHLFDVQSKTYKRMHRPYPCGSNTEGLRGIWQDVFLHVTPETYIDDVFVQPLVARDMLRADITVVNRAAVSRRLTVGGTVCDKDGRAVLTLPQAALTVEANASATVTVETGVAGALTLWSTGAPVLYTAEVGFDGDAADHTSTRFGWRQFAIRGDELCLNGAPVHLVADICHPFGPYMFTREWIASWYRMIQSVGGNAVRLHAQIYPHIFLDVADEMGLAVLDETALFGSSLSLNLEEPVAWERYETHYDGLVRRDRNHPSVFGWSFGNELFALFIYDEAALRDQDGFYRQLTALGERARALDPTRDFITCDGDEDLRGTMPVWSKHFGHGVHPLPENVHKPLVIGESGGTYYARPHQLVEFGGEEVYRSYAGRNHALGIDVFDNVRAMHDRLAYFSPSELVWFGLEPLPYGYSDFSRLPNEHDGIFFKRPADGTPGVYFERIPPLVGTLNPGWDKTLPEYRPLDMYYGMRDGLKKDVSLNKKWAHIEDPRPAAPEYGTRQTVRLVGDPDGAAARTLTSSGLRFSSDGIVAVIDAVTADETAAKAALASGTVLVLLGDTVPTWLPVPLTLTDRTATQLDRAAQHPYVDSLTIADLYTAECDEERRICCHGMDVSGVAAAQVLLTAGEVDWSQFNNVEERVKCGATLLYERLQKPAGAALVRVPTENGEWLLSTISMADDEPHWQVWHRLFKNFGWTIGEVGRVKKEKAEHNLLLDGPLESFKG